MPYTKTYFEHSNEIAVFRLDGRELTVRLNPRFGDPDQCPVLIDCSGEMGTRLLVQSFGQRQIGVDVEMAGDETVESAAARKERMLRDRNPRERS